MAQPNRTVDPIIVDAILLSRQREWESLLDEKEIYNPTDPALQQCDPSFDPDKRVASLYWLSSKQRSLLQRTWMRSAVQGRPIFYPNNPNDLYLYIFRESPVYHTFILLTLIVMFLAPLFQPSYCLREHGFSQARATWLSFTLICIFVQLLDVYLSGKSCHLAPRRNNIANHVQGDSTLSWMKIRVVCCVIIGINSILGLNSITVPSFSLALVPVLFLVTRHHLRQLAEGIFHAFLQIARFPKIWMIFLISWSFMGYCILRRYAALPGGGEVHFGSFQQSIYANFHCMLSRPTVLYRLRTVFDQNNYISFYFVALTVFGDILLTTLVIALGNRAFRNFSARTLNQGLRYRYLAARALFLLYAQPSLKYVVAQEQKQIGKTEDTTDSSSKNDNDADNKEINIQSWLRFCQEASPTLMTSDIDERRLLFASEILSDERYTLQETGLNQAGFFRLLGAMTMTLRMKFRPQQRAILLEKLQQRLFSACVHSLVALEEDISQTTSSRKTQATNSFAFSDSILGHIPLQRISPRDNSSTQSSPRDDRSSPPSKSPRDDLVKLSPRDNFLEKLSPREEMSSFVVVAQNNNLNRDVSVVRPVDIASPTVSQSMTQRYTITSPSLHSMYIDGNSIPTVNTNTTASAANGTSTRPSEWHNRWSEFVTQVSDVNELDVFSPERAAQLAMDFFRQHITYVFGASPKPSPSVNEANKSASISAVPENSIASSHRSVSIDEQRSVNTQVSLENALEDETLPVYRRFYVHFLLFCRSSYISTFDISYYPTNFQRKLKVITSPTSVKYQQTTAKLPWIDTNRTKTVTLRYFRLFTWMVNILVVISTFLLARRNVSSAAIPLLWLVFFGALGRDVVRLVVRETHLTRLRWDVSMNLVFFILLCNLGSRLHRLNQTDESLLMVLQTLRCTLLLWRLPCFALFREIFPVMYRTVMVYAMVVYGFAVLGHITFCQVLTGEALPPTDDDTSSWLPFASFVHFNTFASSLYTVSIVAVLSNWSMVMDAAVVMSTYHTEKAWAYFFFYALRIALTLTIIPLLLSSIMQSFVQRLRMQREKQTMKKQAKRQAMATASGNKRISTIQQKQLELEKLREQQDQRRVDADQLGNTGVQLLTKHTNNRGNESRDSEMSDISVDETGNKHVKAVQDVDFFNFMGDGVALGDSDEDEDDDDDIEEDGYMHVAYSPMADNSATLTADNLRVSEEQEGVSSVVQNNLLPFKKNPGDAREDGTKDSEEDSEGEREEDGVEETEGTTVGDEATRAKSKKKKRKSHEVAIRSDGLSMMSTASDIVVANQRQGFEKQIHSQMSRQMQLQRLKGTQILCREDRLDTMAALWSSTGRALWEKKRMTPYETEEKEVREIVQQAEGLTEQWLNFLPLLIQRFNSKPECHQKKDETVFDRFEIVHSLIVRYQRRFWRTFQANEALFHPSHPSIKNHHHPTVADAALKVKESRKLPGYTINSQFFVLDTTNPTDDIRLNPSQSKDRHYPFIMSDLLQESRHALSRSQRIHLACQWLRDAASGRTLTYPVTNGQLRSLLIHRSSLTTYVLYAVALLQMVSIFFIVPYCSGNDNINLNNSENNYVSRRVLNIFDLLCAVVYIVELVLDVHARFSLYLRWSWWTQTKRWLLLRTCFVALILANSVPPLIEFHSSDGIIKGHFRLVRALFPVLLIARDEGLGDITRGLFRSARRTFPVYMLFITLLLLFAMSGYWLFHRFETNADRFASLPVSFLTILQSATAAPFSLFVIAPYYDISLWTPLFFLILTYASELLCISLIVGAGTVLFASYAEKTMTQRRLQMHQMIQATFVLLLTPSTDIRRSLKEEEKGALSLQERDCVALCHSFVTQAYWWLPPCDTSCYDQDTDSHFDTFDMLLRYAKRNRVLYTTASDGDTQVGNDTTVTREEFSELLMLIFEGVECRRVLRPKISPDSIRKAETVTPLTPPCDTVKDVASPLHTAQDTEDTPSAAKNPNEQQKHDTSLPGVTRMKLTGIQRRISQLQLHAALQLRTQDPSVTEDETVDDKGQNLATAIVEEEEEDEDEVNNDENETDAEVVQHYQAKRRSLTLPIAKRQSLSQYEQQQVDLKRLSLQLDVKKTFPSRSNEDIQEHESVIEVYIKHRYTSLLPLWFPWLLLTNNSSNVQVESVRDTTTSPASATSTTSSTTTSMDRGIFLAGVPLWLQILWEGKDFCDRLCFTFLVTQRSRVSILDMVSIVAHIFLTAQLLLITAIDTVSVGWINLGYFLEVVFWCEMCVRVVSYGEVRYWSDPIAVIRTCINVASLATLCLVSRSDYNFSAETHSGTGVVGRDSVSALDTRPAATTGQRPFRFRDREYLPGVVLVGVDPVLLHHLCTRSLLFDSQAGEHRGGRTGQRRRGLRMEQLLEHFGVFQLRTDVVHVVRSTVLGSWSMVMDAAASISSNDNNNVNPALTTSTYTTSTYTSSHSSTLFNKVVHGLLHFNSVNSNTTSTSTEGTNVNLDSIEPASSYVFFFTFRLFMTLLVLPLLVSYMVRSYVALLDQINFIHVSRHKRRLLPLATVHTLDDTGVAVPVSGGFNSHAEDNTAAGTTRSSPRDIAYAKTKEGLYVSPVSRVSLAAGTTGTNGVAAVSQEEDTASCFPWMMKLVSRGRRLYRAWRHNVLFKFVPLAPETWRYELGFLDIWDVHSLRQTDIVHLYGRQEDYALRVAENVRLEVLAWYGRCPCVAGVSSSVSAAVSETQNIAESVHLGVNEKDDKKDDKKDDNNNDESRLLLLREVRHALLQSDQVNPAYR